MIREFNISDLNGFEPNEFSDPSDVMFIFESDEWWNYTMENNGIKAIICFRDNGDNDWAGFFLISKHFTARDGIKIKEFIEVAASKLKQNGEATRLWTLSKRDEKIRKWHNFIGMNIERTQVLEGVDYNIWSRTWHEENRAN